MSSLGATPGHLRFLCYCRTSSDDLQDPADSRRWQVSRAEALVAGHGEIVVVVHDVGQSRSIPWRRRPEAAAVLAEAARPDRRFDAIVIGEPQRAFAGNEFSLVFPTLTHFGVGLWVPEVNGAVDPGSEAHDILMLLFGGLSKAERRRIQIRVKTAMRSQAAIGRWLGGRPPYGYQLVAVGPHSNAKKAATGAMEKRLDLDPTTAPIVARIFSEYLAGRGLRVLADELTAEGVPSPSAHDPARNPHRQNSAGAWSRAALRAILMNPSYTGTVVWGKSRRQEILIDPADPAQGYRSRSRRNEPDVWVASSVPHPAIVDPGTFEKVQARFLGRRGGLGPRAASKGKRAYALRGRLVCGSCGKRLEGTKVNAYVYYRCRLTTAEYGRNEELERSHPKSAYLREDLILPSVNGWLARIVDPENIAENAKKLAAAAADDVREVGRDAEVERWRRRLMEAQGKLEKWSKALDGGLEPALAAKYMNTAEEERRTAEAELSRLAPERPPTADEVRDLLVALAGIRERLAQADPQVLSEAYEALGLRVVWSPKASVATVEVTPLSANAGVGGANAPLTIRAIIPLAA